MMTKSAGGAYWACLLPLLFISVGEAQVKASLVALDNSVQPARPAGLALRLAHEPGWHTYWTSPGIGMATSIAWDLPRGWTADKPMRWPTPIVIREEDRRIVGQGYEGVVYIPVTLQPPNRMSVGESITIGATVKWLMCAPGTCVPGGQRVTLVLPVFAQSPAPNAEVSTALARMPMPQERAGWKPSACRLKQEIVLRIEGEGAGALKSPHFFSHGAQIQFDGMQKSESTNLGTTMTLPIDTSYDDESNALSGVLSFFDASGVYTGVPISTPILCEKTVPQPVADVACRPCTACSSLELRPAKAN